MNFNSSKRQRLVLIVSLLTLAVPFLAGCPASTNNAGSGGTTAPTETKSGVSGALTIKGSSTVEPLAQAWAEAFQKENTGAEITVSGGGSGQGITALLNGTTDIANASRKMEEKEYAIAKEKKLDIKEIEVARDGITIIVNPKNPIKEITLEQLKGIYTGKTKNWKELGGADLAITASGRDTASGTHAYFKEEVLNKEDYRKDMIANNSNPAIAGDVEKNEGGIGYIGVAYATEFTAAGKVKEVPVAFKKGEAALLPTSENVLSGKYPISRALYNYVAGEPNGVKKAYLDFVTGPEGQKIVKEQGFITLK